MKLTTALVYNSHVAQLEDFVTARQEAIMPGTTPMPVSVRNVRELIGLFTKVKAAYTPACGSALWVYINWCQLNHFPYTLELHHNEMIPSAWIIKRILL